jgi:hypothetical protein
MLPGDLCRHPEGWGPVSRLRPFDLTPCFEDAVLFSVPLGLLIALSLLRSWHLSRLSALRRTQKINTWLLWAKLVRVSACTIVLFRISLLSDPPRLSLASFCQLASSTSALPLFIHITFISSRCWS